MPRTPSPAPPVRRAYRCAAGCLHLQWDRLTLTFTPGEFAHLRELVEEAARAAAAAARPEAAREETGGASGWNH